MRRVIAAVASIATLGLVVSAGVDAGLVADVPTDLVFDQSRSDVNSSPEEFDGFGSAVAAADFNNDGRIDLAVGVSGEGTGSPTMVAHGVVQVFYRGPDGSLSGVGQDFIEPENLPGGSRSVQGFGASLAAGDFDGDGIVDLAIGAPFRLLPAGLTFASQAGGVHIVYGTEEGLDTTSAQFFSPNSPTLGGAQAGGFFGFDLIAADFDGDGIDDLAAGEPGRNFMTLQAAGRAVVFFGRTGRFNVSDTAQLTNTSIGSGIGGQLVAGDFDGDGSVDLAAASIGVFSAADRVLVWRSNGAGRSFDTPGVTIINAASIGRSDVRLNQSGLGVAVGDFDVNGVDDLAISWREDTTAEAGVAVLLMTAGAPGSVNFDLHDFEPGDAALGGDEEIGAKVAAGDYDGDGIDDLVMSGDAPNVVHMVPSSVSGFVRNATERGTYDVDVGSLESIDVSGDGISDLAVLDPGAEVDDVMGAGRVIIDSGANERPRTFSPLRLLDTRGQATVDGDFSGGGPIADGEIVRVRVAGRAGIPADASGAIVNVTIVRPDKKGFATVFPCGNTVPTASTVNYRVDETRANAAVVALSDDGDVCVFTLQRSHIVIDATGYSAAETAISTRTPIRLLDTREAGETFDGLFVADGRRGARSVTRLQVGGRSSIPAGRTALVNVTVVNPLANGFVTVWDCNGPIPNASNVNYVAGQTVANGAVVAVAASNEICLFTLSDVHLVVDLSGTVGVAARVELDSPARMIDTRSTGQTIDGQSAAGGRIGAFEVVEVPIAGRGQVPASARTVALNLTVVRPSAGGFATLFPCDGEPPTVSNVNYRHGANTANNAISELSATGSICYVANVETDVVIDVAGWVS